MHLRARSLAWLLGPVGALLVGASAGASVHWTLGLSSASAAQSKMGSKPAAPGGVTAACVSSSADEVVVSWNAVSHATGYKVYKSKTSGSYASAGSATTHSWTSGALTSGSYTFKVTTSVGAHWTSTKSSATSPARTIATTPASCS